jgi:hypothetical protein
VIGLVEKVQKEERRDGLIATPVVKIKKPEEKLVKHVGDLLEKKEQNTHPVGRRLVPAASVVSTEKNQKLERKDSYYEN